MTCTCGQPHYARGMCRTCYDRHLRASMHREQCPRKCAVVCDAWASRYDRADGETACDAQPPAHKDHAGFWTLGNTFHCNTCHNRRTAQARTRGRWGEQPAPIPGGESVTDAAIAFLQQRREKGIATYGTELTTHNGRDALRDAVEEAADLYLYLYQVYMEAR